LNKTHKTCKTHKRGAAVPNWVAAGKRAGWPLSLPKNGFDGFESFVSQKK
jgi:hypothetical protein